MKTLCDEMYPPALAVALRRRGIEASTVVELGLAGRSDPDILSAATVDGYAVLSVDEASDSIELNRLLLEKQFELTA